MLDSKLFINAITQLQEERNIPVETMVEALEEAFVKTYRREFDPEADLRVDIDVVKGEIKLFHLKNIVEVVEDELTEISLKEALEISATHKIGDKHEIEVQFNEEFGTLAALQVKQIIRQKVREKEKELVLSEYLERIGEIIEGNVESEKEYHYIIAFDRTFGYLNKLQVHKGKTLSPGDKIQAAIINIDKNSKGLPIILSMTSAEIVKRIIEEEVPEVKSGDVVIEKIARYAGARTKMIVKSNAPGLDAVGTIIGENGTRIKRIIEKVGREFIDIIPSIEDKATQIAKAFVPAKPIFIKLDKTEDDEDRAIVVVTETDFSSAIGRGGSNAKVVSRLMDIKIDVKKEMDVDFEFTKTVYETKKSKPADVDISKFLIEENNYEDDLFTEQKEQNFEPEENFGFEDVADIPEIDDFEGFVEEDELFDEGSEEAIETKEEEIEDFDKYYE